MRKEGKLCQFKERIEKEAHSYGSFSVPQMVLVYTHSIFLLNVEG